MVSKVRIEPPQSLGMRAIRRRGKPTQDVIPISEFPLLQRLVPQPVERNVVRVENSDQAAH